MVSIMADHITETDANSIPTGSLTNISGTPFNYGLSCSLGKTLAELNQIGFDDNYCVFKRNEDTHLKIVAV